MPAAGRPASIIARKSRSGWGFSPHTVDQRIRGALEKLGVERRGEAARHGRGRSFPATTGISALDTSIAAHRRRLPCRGHQDGAVSHQIRHADRAGEVESSRYQYRAETGRTRLSLPLPFATRSHPSNEMSVGLRLLWIVLIAMGAAFSAGMYLAGLESLSRMISG